MNEAATDGAWIPERTGDGTWTLRSRRLDEACHNRVGAWTEALERYAIPCRLRERARPGVTLRVLDVGTGLGWNLAAALRECVERGARLEAVSLEVDREVLRAALRLGASVGGASAASEPERWWAPVRAALGRALGQLAEGEDGVAVVPLGAPGDGRVAADEGRLELVLGDARATLPALDERRSFDAVFLDPFSPARAPDLWAPVFLGEVARRMGPGSWLSTYSVARAVRRGLDDAGLRVGPGPPCGPKREGTLAYRGAPGDGTSLEGRWPFDPSLPMG